MGVRYEPGAVKTMARYKFADTVKAQLRVPRAALDKADALAAKHDVTRSRVLVDAIRKTLKIPTTRDRNIFGSD